MGAENSILEGCEWNEPLESSLPWIINPVVKPDGAAATVFQAKKVEKKDGDMLKKNTAILRGIRHPNIIRFVGGGEARDDVWLATEYVTPLMTSMVDLTSDEICVGLHDILQALDFLHSTLGMSHNNVCMSSLFLGHDGTWKLGELQHACKFSDATQAFLDQCRAFRKEDCLAPEEKAGAVTLDPSTGHARDMFAFGAVVDSLLEGLQEKDACVRELEVQASSCFSSEPSLRPTAASLLKLQFLRSDLFEIIEFLKNVTMKSDADKKDFFSTIVPRLEKLPQPVIARRLVIPLLARFVLLDESANGGVIPRLLTPKTGIAPHGLLCEGLFQQYVIPQLYNIFHVHDCHIRLVLLQHFSQYARLFTRPQLDDDIFLQILLGVRDSDDRVVAASLRALADLVPIMGGDVVVGAARKPFFFHGLPKQVNPQDLAKMSSPQNVASVLSSHKPLLKDLAAGSLSAMMKKEVGSEEKDRKAREREQRREEAKLKREERRKRLKEKQIDTDDGDHKDLKSTESTLTIEEVARLEAKGHEGLATDDVGDGLNIGKSSSNDGLNTTNNGNFDNHKNGEVGVEDGEGKVATNEEKEGPDWSDWEDADKRIEEEIENELQQMSDGSDVGGSKVQTSPSPYRKQSPAPTPGPPVSVNWDCDVPEAERDFRGVDHSPAAAESHAGAGHNNNSSSSSGASNVVEGGRTLSTSKSLKLTKSPGSASSAASSEISKASRKAGTKGKGVPSGPAKNGDDLGAGLDIKSVEIKRTEPELDFFADMAPSIQLASKSALPAQLDSVGLNDGESEQKVGVNSQLFAVNAAPEEHDADTAGWGDVEDGLDWDAEGF
ncbi:hypothetical protein EGW08_006324 [Elysia chlorotica]|uniref:Protein kinase domain-containing protein n=1 Tax=Elysia chlorotica TaxID=188477 RepID=A0A3S1A998_ELYCH|nr:hypothetical protein EGW08_006324 [Elysia chlorotica]